MSSRAGEVLHFVGIADADMIARTRVDATTVK